MKKFAAAFPAIILLSLSILAQVGGSGSGQTNFVSDAASGLSFSVPALWSSAESDGGYVLMNRAKTASIVVKAHAYNDFESFVEAEIDAQSDQFRQLTKVYDLGNGSRHVRVSKAYNGRNFIIDAFFLAANGKGGAIVLSLATDPATANQVFPAAAEVVKSLKFSRPQQQSSPAPQNSALQASFAGKKLSYYYTGNGYSENRTIWLCASGAYFSKSESISISALGSGSTSGGDQGTWQVRQSGGTTYLILYSQKGGQGQYEISARQASNEIGLNGKRYFVETHNECR